MTTELATVRMIEEFEPIEGATKVTRARISGDVWVVTGIANGFQVDDMIAYIKPGSFVPTETASFLTNPDNPLSFNGKSGGVVTQAKIRGHVSDGVIIPLGKFLPPVVGTDITEELGIEFWVDPQA